MLGQAADAACLDQFPKAPDGQQNVDVLQHVPLVDVKVADAHLRRAHAGRQGAVDARLEFLSLGRQRR